MNIRTLMLGVAAVALMGSAAGAQESLDLGHVGDPGSLYEATAEKFAECVAASGKATVEVYGSSQLGNDEEMLHEEGLDNVFARHQRHAAATRAAVEAWGLEVLCADPAQHSGALTAVLMPEGKGADALRKVILERFDMSLGAGLSKLADKIFRIGHLGDYNDLTLIGTLGGVEMGLQVAGVAHKAGGVQAAMAVLAQSGAAEARQAAE